jgi:DNA-binding Lrp family transcriptional regulator
VDSLPKYIQNANRVLDVIHAEPDNTWVDTQRKLGEKLGLSQPDLSNLIRLLRENGRIQHGAALPGRGRIHALVALDATPLDNNAVRLRSVDDEQDRALNPGEEMTGAFELGSLSVDQVGLAIIRMIRKASFAEERHVQTRSELTDRLSAYREQMASERDIRMNLARKLEKAERTNADLEREVSTLRGEVNNLLIRLQNRHQSKGGVPIADLLDDSELEMMRRLIVEKPGQYREGDKEVLAAS